MSFFYDLNKKLDSIRATPEVTHQQLNERDLGKHNNATTGFAALAKKTGGGEKGARIAGAQLAKMRAKGQVEEEFGPGTSGPNRNQAGPDTSPDANNYKTPNMDRYFDAVQSLDKTMGQGYSQKTYPGAGVAAWDADARGQNQYVDRTRPGIINTIKDKLGYDMPDPAYGPKPDERERLAKRYPVKEADATPQDVGSYEDEVKAANAPKSKASAPARTAPKPPAKPKPSQAMDDEIDESAFQAAIGKKKYGEQGMKALQKAGRDHASDSTMNRIRNRYDKYDESMGMTDEGNAFSKAVVDAKRDGVQPGEKIRVGGKEYPVKEEGMPMTAKQKSFAKLAPPADKITFADKIAGAKKEVDEMLGNVAADAMKKAIGGGRGRNAEMDESFWDDEPTSRRSSSGGRIDTSKPGVTVHRAVKGNYSGAGYDVGDETSSTSSDGPRGRGRPKGSRRAIGAKINRGTSKLMTRECDQDPEDQGEYGREGEMGRNEIHTMMRNAKQLEKMLGNNDDLPEWVQKKLSLASDYMQTIADYLASEKETDAEDQTGREVEVELAEKKAPSKKTVKNDNRAEKDGKKVTKDLEYDMGHKGKDDAKAERAGKKVTKDIEYDDKKKKSSIKKEEEVEESTTAGSVATAPGSSKGGSKGGFTFGKGIYDSIDRAVERQINESMNISMNMSNDENGGPGQTLTITATDEDATQLAQLLKMAGLGSNESETCSTCGMADCGCGDMEQMDETYGDNVVNMNSPDYPSNTEKAHDNFGYSGGLNKQKASGMATIPVTDVSLDGEDRFSHYAESRDELARIREIAGLRPMSEDKAEWLKPEGMPGDEPTAPGGVEKKKEGDTWVYKPKDKDARLTSIIPSKYVDPNKPKNESIFTDTANLWKSYKG